MKATEPGRALLRACLLLALLPASGACNTLQSDAWNTWVSRDCIRSYREAEGAATIYVRLNGGGGNRHKVEVSTICTGTTPQVWIDGEGPYRDGALASIGPGWHVFYAEASGRDGVQAVHHSLRFVPSTHPELDCHIRAFWLEGEEPNAVLYAPPRLEWSAAANDLRCRPERCRRDCGDLPEGASIRYRLFFDENPVHLPGRPGKPLPEIADDCGGHMQVPDDVWHALRDGFHSLTVQAELLVSGEIRAVKSVRYGFHKAIAPAGLAPPARWDPPSPASYQVSGRILCQGDCGSGAYAVEIAGDPSLPSGNSLTGVLDATSGNFAVLNRAERIRYTDFSRFSGRAGGAVLEPRLLPAGRARQGGRMVPAYRDLLADERGRTLQGHCNPAGDMAGIAACAGRGFAVDRHVIWDGRPGAFVQAVTGPGLRFAPGDDLYVAEIRLRAPARKAARVRIGWNSRSPRVLDQTSSIPTHRSATLRLEPGTTTTHLLRIQMAPPPPPAGSRGRSPLMGKDKAFWIIVYPDRGIVSVESIRLYRVEEGFIGSLPGVGAGETADLYFDDFDRLPSPVRARVPLLSGKELRDLQTSGRRARFQAEAFHRIVDRGPCGSAMVFAKEAPYVQVGPHAGPRPDQLLHVPAAPRPVAGRQEIIVARNQRRAETTAFHVWQGCPGEGNEGTDLTFPGRGSLTLPGGDQLDYEIWTSLAYLSQGTGWNWKDSYDTPLVTNLFLTKGGRPQFAAHNSRLRADEAMNVELALDAGATQKLIVNLSPRPGPGRERMAPGVYDTEITAGPLLLPLRVRVADLDLPPERNNWIQSAPHLMWDGGTPDEQGCDFDVPGWPSGHRKPGCSMDQISGFWGEDYVRICDDDYDYLARRIRDHSFLGVAIKGECRKVARCTTDACPRDPGLPFHAGACADGGFLDQVERIAAAFGSVDPLPPPDYASFGGPEPPHRPWVASTIYPGYAAWPQCWSPEGVEGCPEHLSGRAILTRQPGAQMFASIRAIQATGMAALPFFTFMDDIAGGGPLRAASHAVLIDSFHDYGAGSVVTHFEPLRGQTYLDMVEKARVETDPPDPGLCERRCGYDGRDHDIHDLERILRWTQFYGSRFGDTPDKRYLCPIPGSSGGYNWTWTNFVKEVERQRQIDDVLGEGPGCRTCRLGDNCYCCSWERGEEERDDACGEGSSYNAPWGRCLDEEPPACRFDPSEDRDWCPRFIAGPGSDDHTSNVLDVVAYSIGRDWFLDLQEDCYPGRPCPHNRPWRQEQGMWPEVFWKLPFNSRFTGGFWTGASNLDGFHPYHLYGRAAHNAQTDMFSNFAGWQRNPVGFIYKAESVPGGEECEGSCSGVIMTESWEALRTGYTDVRWWDALVALPDGGDACGRRRRALIERARTLALPYGIGAAGGGRNPIGIPYGNNYWIAPGYVAETVSDTDLEALKRDIVNLLVECRENG